MKLDNSKEKKGGNHMKGFVKRALAGMLAIAMVLTSGYFNDVKFAKAAYSSKTLWVEDYNFEQEEQIMHLYFKFNGTGASELTEVYCPTWLTIAGAVVGDSRQLDWASCHKVTKYINGKEYNWRADIMISNFKSDISKYGLHSDGGDFTTHVYVKNASSSDYAQYCDRNGTPIPNCTMFAFSWNIQSMYNEVSSNGGTFMDSQVQEMITKNQGRSNVSKVKVLDRNDVLSFSRDLHQVWIPKPTRKGYVFVGWRELRKYKRNMYNQSEYKEERNSGAHKLREADGGFYWEYSSDDKADAQSGYIGSYCLVAEWKPVTELSWKSNGSDVGTSNMEELMSIDGYGSGNFSFDGNVGELKLRCYDVSKVKAVTLNAFIQCNQYGSYLYAYLSNSTAVDSSSKKIDLSNTGGGSCLDKDPAMHPGNAIINTLTEGYKYLIVTAEGYYSHPAEHVTLTNTTYVSLSNCYGYKAADKPKYVPKDMTIGDIGGTINNSSKTGYTPVGFCNKNNVKASTSLDLSDVDTAFVEGFSVNKYAISYNLNGGSVSGNPGNYNITSSNITLVNPTKTGYTFTGWTGSNGTTPQTTITIAKGSTGDKSYTANWTTNNYKLKFNANGGSVSESERSVAYGSQYGNLPNPSRTGYTFAGWYTSAGDDGTKVSNTTTMGSGDTTVYAHWNTNTYSITYDLDGGKFSYGRVVSYTVESDTFTLDNPVKTGYTFTGWTGSNGTTPQTTVTIVKGSTGNKSYKAYWASNNYTLKFDANGGSVGESERSVACGSQYGNLPNPSRTGYTFAGWYTDKTGGTQVSNTTTMSAGNTTVYAHWNINSYKQCVRVRYENADGSFTAYSDAINKAYNYGSTVSWSKTADDTYKAANITSYTVTAAKTTEVTVYRNTHKVTVSKGTGINSVSGGGSYRVGQTVKISASLSNGYSWKNWTGSVTSTDQTYTETMGTSDLSYTANATAISYSITYDLDGGSVSGNPNSYTIETNNFTLKNPTKTGYTFKGWTGSNGGTASTTVTISKGSTGNKSFKANWTKNYYDQTVEVRYENADGSFTEYQKQTPVSKAYGDSFSWSRAQDNTYQAASITSYTVTSAKTTQVTVYRRKFDLNLSVGTGVSGTSGTETYRVGQSVTIDATVKNGYTWVNWTGTLGNVAQKRFTFNMPSKALSLTANASLDAYLITYALNGGSVSDNPTSYSVESNTFTLKNPTRVGYTFTGWTGSNGTTPQTTVTIVKGSTGAKNYTANWKARNDIKYQVKHWKQNISGDANKQDSSNYTLAETVDLTGTSDSTTTPDRIAYTGFTAPSGTKITIAADGSTVLNYYYTRNSYTVSLSKATGVSSVSGDGTYKYGQKVMIDATVAYGYTWKNWTGYATNSNKKFSFDMPAQSITYKAEVTTNKYTQTVRVRYEQADGTFSEYREEAATGREYLSKYSWSRAQDDTYQAAKVDEYTVTADKTTEVTIYRRKFSVKANSGNGISGTTGSETYRVGQSVTVNATVKPGYTWAGWTGTQSSKNQKYSFNMPSNDVTLEATTDLITYSISYDLAGGKVSSEKTKYNVETETFTLVKPTRAGYDFVGWTGTDVSTAKMDVTISKGSLDDRSFTAHWKARTDTVYTVRHWQERIGGDAGSHDAENYTLIKTETFRGTTDTIEAPERKQFTGFTAPAGIKVNVDGDGSAAVDYYYTRNSYELKVVAGNGTKSTSGSGTYEYDQTITAKAVLKAGYTWKSWTGDLSSAEQTYVFKMPAADISITATTNIITYNLLYDLAGGKIAKENPTTYNVETGTFTLNNPTRAGYDFLGWTGSNGTTPQTEVTIPVGSLNDRSFKANWKARTDTPYKVQHWQQNVRSDADKHDANNYTLVDTDEYTGTTDTKDAPKTKNYTGFTAPAAQVMNIDGDGKAVLNYYYTRNSYKLTLKGNLGIGRVIGEGMYQYDETVKVDAVVDYGYTWKDWTGDYESTEKEFTFKMPAEKVRLDANATVNFYQQTVMMRFEKPDGSFTDYEEAESVSRQFNTQYTWTRPADDLYYAASVSYNVWEDTTKYVDVMRKQYKLTLTAGYGIESVEGDGSYRIDEVVGIKAKVKPGYTWSKWVEHIGEVPEQEYQFKMISMDLGLTAKATLNTYDIKYDLAGGKVSGNPETYTVESKDFTLTNPTRQGYDFVGWCEGDSEETSDNVTIETGSIGNKEFTAVWSPRSDIKYTVKHWKENLDANTDAEDSDNYTLADTDELLGVTDTKVTPDRKDYEGFTAPKGVEINIDPDGSVVLDYYYTRNSYNLELTKGAGIESVNGAGKYQYAAPIAINAVVKEGYTWKDWTGTKESAVQGYTFSMPAAGVSLTANATANHYNVVFHGNHETSGEMEKQEFVYDEKANLNQCAYKRTGYTFLGWSTNKSATDADYTDACEVANLADSGEIDLYAIWKANSYIIKFNGCDATSGNTKDQNVVYDQSADLRKNGFEKTGYTFQGWSVTSGGAVKYHDEENISNLTESGDFNLYAVWKANEYNIKLNLGQKTITIPAVYDQEVTLPKNSVENPGYTFKGWSTVSGGAVMFKDEEIVKNLTESGEFRLYPVWGANEYRIVFNSGEDSAEQFVEYDKVSKLNKSEFKKPGYSFEGWSTVSDGAVAFKDCASVKNLVKSGDFNLYAVWKANKYTVVYDSNDENAAVVRQNAIYDEEVETLDPKFSRRGYTFKDFNTQKDGKGTAYRPGDSMKNLAESGEVSLYAIWDPNPNTMFLVIDRIENVENDDYSDTQRLCGGPTDSLTEYDLNDYPGCITPEKKAVEHIKADGTTKVVNVYKRKHVTVKAESVDGIKSVDGTGEYKWGASVVLTFKPVAGYAVSDYEVEGDYKYFTKLDGGAVNFISNGDVTVKPVLVPLKYAINYALDGGTLTEPYTKEYTYGKITELPIPTRKGYRFMGWKNKETGASVKAISADMFGDIILEAVWKKDVYQVNYVLNGGKFSGDPVTSRSYGDTVVLSSDVTRRGCTFDGWYTDEDYKEKISSIPADCLDDVTVYAKWSKKAYTISFETNGGKFSDSVPEKYTFGEEVDLPVCISKAGFNFAGWYEDPTFEDKAAMKVTADKVGDKTYYAKWNVQSFKIVYSVGTGGAIKDSEYATSYNVYKETVLPTNVQRKGFSFAGWLDENGKIATKISAGELGDREFTALWQSNSSSLIVDTGDTEKTTTEEQMKNSVTLTDEIEESGTGYYYTQLSENAKAVYATLFSAYEFKPDEVANETDPSKVGIKVDDLTIQSEEKISYEDRMDAGVALTLDHPEIFWVRVFYSSSYKASDGKYYYTMTPSLAYNQLLCQLDAATYSGYFKKAIAAIGIDEKDSKYEKVQKIHKYVISTYSYADLGYTLNAETSNDTRSVGRMFSTKEGCCEGYARMFKVFCDYYDIPCVLANSETHMWDLVEMNDKWYGVDTTWDVPDSEKYLLKGSGVFSSDEHRVSNHKFVDAEGKVVTTYACLAVPEIATSDFSVGDTGEDNTNKDDSQNSKPATTPAVSAEPTVESTAEPTEAPKPTETPVPTISPLIPPVDVPSMKPFTPAPTATEDSGNPDASATPMPTMSFSPVTAPDFGKLDLSGIGKNGENGSTVADSSADGSTSGSNGASGSIVSTTETLKLGKGEKVVLKCTDVTDVKTSDVVTTKVVTNGIRFTGKKVGSIPIVVTFKDGSTKTVMVSVLKAPKKLKVSRVVLKKGKKKKLKVKFAKGQYSNKLIYRVKGKSAKVTKAGKVVAKKRGVSKVTIKAFNGTKKVIKVVVR